MHQNLLEAQDAVIEIIHAAQDNEKLKREFISNPKQIIENKLGKKINLPEDVSIVVEEQNDPSIVYLNIPRELNIDDFELTEEDLEQVSGGSTPLCYLGVAALAAGATYGIAYAVGYYTA